MDKPKLRLGALGYLGDLYGTQTFETVKYVLIGITLVFYFIFLLRFQPLELVCEPCADYVPWRDDVPKREVG